MNATFQMREKRSFEVYSEWSSPVFHRRGPPPDLSRESSQRAQSLIFRRRHRSGKVCSDTSAGKVSPNRVQRLRIGFHYVVSSTAMNMNVDKSRYESGLTKVICCLHSIVVVGVQALYLADTTIFYSDERILDH